MILCDYCGEKYDPAKDSPFVRVTVSGMSMTSAPMLDLQLHPECVNALAADINQNAGKHARPQPLPPVKQPTNTGGRPILPPGGVPLIT